MLCTTCHGKGYVTVPYIAGVVSAQYPCPECHAGCQHCCDGDTMPTPPSYKDIINSKDTVWKGEDE